MRTSPRKEDLSELYKQCSEYLTTADHNMVRDSKEAFENSLRVRHMEVKEIVHEAHELGVINKDTLFKNGAWMGDDIEDITILGENAPFYKAVITTPASGRPLRASLPEKNVNHADNPYRLKHDSNHLDNIVGHIRNTAKRMRIDERQECQFEL